MKTLVDIFINVEKLNVTQKCLNISIKIIFLDQEFFLLLIEIKQAVIYSFYKQATLGR